MNKLVKISLVIALVSAISCSNDLPDREEIKQNYYDAKVKALLDKKEKICKMDAAEAAQSKVDSLLDQLINASLFDTLNFPLRPVKPATPEHIIDKVSKFEVEG